MRKTYENWPQMHNNHLTGREAGTVVIKIAHIAFLMEPGILISKKRSRTFTMTAPI
jgi:hypothetical protein